MTGIDARTGKALDPWDHTCQSIMKIIRTRIGARVMREEVGSIVPDNLFQPMSNENLSLVYWAIAVAIALYEPRFRLVRFIPDETAATRREGQFRVIMVGEFMPRGHLGDFAVAKSNVTVTYR